MINRQAMRGAGTKTTTKAPARTKPAKGTGARGAAKAKSNSAAAGAKRRTGRAGATGSKTKAAIWRGEEVFSPTATSAEEGAARAEGNAPIPAELALRDPDPGTYTEKGPARRRRANDPDVRENEEEKRQSAVEEHASMPSRHFPHGRL